MNQPIARFRAGQVSCALWENEIQVNGTSKTVLKASVSRRYKDKNGEWKSSQSFGRGGVGPSSSSLTDMQGALGWTIEGTAPRLIPLLTAWWPETIIAHDPITFAAPGCQAEVPQRGD
ncbi:MAG: hypothetical protein ISS72_07465 [Candidatus Brocadiae bacterium]|nr:hypothetical protein [Candidatus Brocadiia bacterium]